jgi:hypothetical protein
MRQSGKLLRDFPLIHCPACGTPMRLSTIVPLIGQDGRDRMTFVCDCEFEYHQSVTVAEERGFRLCA